MAREPVKTEIPPGTRFATCRGCGGAIAWIATAAGKRTPVDGDGTSHWATCPQASRFKPKAKPA